MNNNTNQPGRLGALISIPRHFHSNFNAKHWNSILTAITYALLVMGLLAASGCRHDDDDDDGGPVNANPVGYYDETGTATVKLIDNTTDLMITDLQGMINGNQFKVMSMAEHLLYDGTITAISGNNFTASVTIFRMGEIIGTTTLNGVITEGSSITGTLTGTGAGNGTFDLVFSLSNSQLADIIEIDEQTWEAAFQGFASNFLFIMNNVGVIYNGGATTSNIFSGCRPDIVIPANGNFSVIAGTSLFQVDINLEQCDVSAVNGNYTGVATPQTDTFFMTMIISNDTYALYSEFTLP